ncbi:MAG: 4-hydroxy-tetrahydrodipicolinate reductase [Spirochaetales bacterium]|nr:4-hydroxy-tetrahydrodipicolinate reductase [Spirochaetales bacterium]
MIKVILIGSSGKMGQILSSSINAYEDMEVVAGIDLRQNGSQFPVYEKLKDVEEDADVIIDFSNPATLPLYLQEAISRKIPAVIATTGLDEADIEKINEASKTIAIFRSANMSLGINLLQNLVRTAASILGNSFDVEIIEKHHNMKKDAPSGTAFMLAESVNEAFNNKLSFNYGRHGKDCKRSDNEIGIHAVRGGTIVGEHDVIFAGNDEVITINHSATSRSVFATGGIAAARFLTGCKAGL